MPVPGRHAGRVPLDDRWTTPAPARLPAALVPFVRTLQGYGATGMVPSVT